ncbi:MAG: hypothetical protein OEY74_09375 [Gammaproteobacteria bacterium]|nr:hypothetical protein [Gammaproteobacteria bacterium]
MGSGVRITYPAPLLQRVAAFPMVQALSPIPAVWLGEIVLVVLGILIALQIDNWNDVRVDRYYSDL